MAKTSFKVFLTPDKDIADENIVTIKPLQLVAVSQCPVSSESSPVGEKRRLSNEGGVRGINDQ
jgi:hypothetical protein